MENTTHEPSATGAVFNAYTGSSIGPEISSRSAYKPSTSTSSPPSRHTFSSGFSSPADNSRVALITGAAQGIGRGIALRFARDGYKVAICDLPGQSEKLQELKVEIHLLDCGKSQSLGGGEGEGRNEKEREEKVTVLFVDVSREEDVRVMVERCVSVFGGLDVMVANAGIAIYKPLLELPVEEFDSVVAVNLRGAMLCYKYAAQQMVKQGRGGRIIGASSMYGKAGAPNLAGYSASKFGIRGLTHTAALEWGKYRITVNAYAPAGIKTPMLEDYDDRLTLTNGMKKGEFLERLGNRAAVGYLGGPTEVASLVSYLASPEAHFITGMHAFFLLIFSESAALNALVLTIMSLKICIRHNSAGQTISVDGGSFVD
ncbi:hypothetical protein ACEPAH_7707 [Sanghuangporus vaninii]